MLYELAYDAIALGMWVNSRTLFRVTTIGPQPSRLEPGTLIVTTHRAESDVPVVAPSIYFGFSLWRRRAVRPHFAAREDLFEPGFFAGFPAGLPPALRRALYGLGIGSVLARLPMHPVPYPDASRLRLGRALAGVPAEMPLEPVVPAAALGAFRERARRAGLREPETAGDVLRGEYADLLWRFYPRSELAAPPFEPLWDERAARATAEIRGLVDLVRSGRVLLLFPEGRPSPDGAIGPVRGGAGMLVRRGRPDRILPVGLAYDPLGRGRPRVFVAFGQPLQVGPRDVEREILRALLSTMPLTCGQVLAWQLAGVADTCDARLVLRDLDETLAAEVAAARDRGRPVDPALEEPEGRRERLSTAAAAICRLGIARTDGRRALEVDPDRARESPVVARLALEYASARAGETLDAVP